MWCYRLSLDVVPCFVRKRACAVLSCESVEALAVKLGVYALLRAAARAGALPQRARAMCGARARGVASLRQLCQRLVLPLL